MDTVIFERGPLHSFKWLFTDKYGIVKKKTSQNSTIELIISKFVQTLNHQSDTKRDNTSTDAAAHYISSNEFRELNRKGLVDILHSNDLKEDDAIQMQKPLLEDSARYIAEFKLDDGRPLVKCWKTYLLDGQEIKVQLASPNIIEVFKSIGQTVISSIEKNSHYRLASLNLLFCQDITRKF